MELKETEERSITDSGSITQDDQLSMFSSFNENKLINMVKALDLMNITPSEAIKVLKGIQGDYYNVVGLPLAHLLRIIKRYE